MASRPSNFLMKPPFEQIKDAQFAAESSLFDIELDESPQSQRHDYKAIDFICDENGDLEKAPVKLESRGVSSHAELWDKALLHSQSVISKLLEIRRLDLASPLQNCHTEESCRVCTGCRRVSIFFNRCERFYCPSCQPRLARERRESVEWWAKEIREPKHVVLTVRNVDTFTKDYVNWFKQCWGRLRRRKFARGWRGGFYRLEVTNEKPFRTKDGTMSAGGWHLHLHALIDAGWIDARILAQEWAEIVGQSFAIVKVKDVHGADYLAEVTKYAVKGNIIASWSGDKIAEFVDAFTGVKTFGVFGALYGKRTEWRAWIDQLQAGRVRCACGCEKFRILSPQELAWEKILNETKAGNGSRPPPLDTPDLPNLGLVDGRPRPSWFFEDQ